MRSGRRSLGILVENMNRSMNASPAWAPPQRNTLLPFFSIVIPAYNRSVEIVRAVDSCLRQDFSDFEIVVVDDRSTDHTAEVVRRYNDVRINLICHAANRGVCPARNTGVSHANGQWIIFLDSDDELLP